MSGEGYMRKRSVQEVGFGKQDRAKTPVMQFKDDQELLAYLLEQEHLVELCETVSFESLTSD